MVFSCQRSQKLLTPVPTFQSSEPLYSILIPVIAITFQHLASKPDHEIFSVLLREIEQALKSKVKRDPATTLPKAYKDFLNIFSYKETNKLPPYYPGVDHTIHMKPRT